jgi:hypothetical protein
MTPTALGVLVGVEVGKDSADEGRESEAGEKVKLYPWEF